jgi:eukaryotic-like serine/threonine-protein kinase
MSYCVNPRCHNRQNSQNTKYCVTCSTLLSLYGDRFQIIEKISTSSPSHAWEVFKVIDTQVGSANAYKVLKTLKNNSPLHKELFDREKTALQKLLHSGIPAYVMDFVLPAERDRPELDCLVMELVEGQDLSKWVESNKLSNKETALQWLKKITSILSYIHDKKYFHRDIKPGNIMLKSNGELSLIDYGIAREITDTVYEKGASTKAYTLAYAAPEQMNGAAVPQSDFYALGRTFVHLLTGMSPDSKKLDLSMWEHETDFPTSGIIPLLKWMLKEDHAQRPETAQKIIEIIDYISTRKPDGNFPNARDTENQINNGTLLEKAIKEDITVPPRAKPITLEETILPPPKPPIPDPGVFDWLKTFKMSGRNLILLPIFFIGIAVSTLLIMQLLYPKLEEACNSVLGDGISCGEEILLKEANRNSRKNKKDGARLIVQGKFSEAIKPLTTDWKENYDPETSIMLENAKLVGVDTLVRSIAVAIPGSQSTPQNIPTGMLKAVASAQQRWNENLSNKWKIRLVLVDDQNNKDIAVKLTDTLLKRGIYAGIGSYSSDVTLPVKDVYQRNSTVLISGTSTATGLTNPDASFFFRVCSSSEKSTQKITNYLEKNNYKKIALFHTAGEAFSDSMTNELKKDMGRTSIVKAFNFKGAEPAINQIKKAKKLGAQAIVLFPGAYTSGDPERDRTLSIVKENNGELPIIGNEIVKDPTLFSLEKKLLQKLVISLPWHPSLLGAKEFDTPKYWGDKKQLDHRIVMNYDAIQTIIKALDQLPINKNEDIVESRRKIQKILSNPGFKMSGYTGNFSFEGSDRRETVAALVKPLCNKDNKCAGYEAVP